MRLLNISEGIVVNILRVGYTPICHTLQLLNHINGHGPVSTVNISHLILDLQLEA